VLQSYFRALADFFAVAKKHQQPLYQLLKKAEHFAWTAEAKEALDKLKRMLTTALILVPPRPVEPLLLYVAATT